ncbi:MAG TPA: SGNH/GDSL hydrolase family protein [Jiangellaceae bacterium]|nr:SGNH/GDSL hydrolase family protein [Jiangellaceae bacterium]
MAPKRVLRSFVLFVVALLVLGVVGATAPASAQSGQRAPSSMAALGDSITRGFNACGWYLSCPSRSWSTGTYQSVNSHYARILAKNPAIQGHQFNNSSNGAKISDLNRQAQLAVSQQVEYVTILIGANDACTSTESGMTSVAAFEQRFRTAMATLNEGLKKSSIFVASIPDVKRLWEIGKNSFAARTAWSLGNTCQSMLANPQSTASADVERRDRVQQRVIDYNSVLAKVCAEYRQCRFDDNAVFSYRFTLSHVSQWDYFHPNTAGQAVLAEVTYNAGYGW